MPKTIQQSVTFPVRAAKLFPLYANGKLHSAVTGQVATVGKAAGGRFSAFNGMIRGKLLHVVRNKLIVQTWRGMHWKASDRDSVLVLRFEDTPKGGRVDLVHSNVPDHDGQGVNAGWRKFYWEPWAKFLAKPVKKGKSGAAKTARRKGKRAAPKAKRGPTVKPTRKAARTTRRSPR